jgi:hypothetical protein
MSKIPSSPQRRIFRQEYSAEDILDGISSAEGKFSGGYFNENILH